MRHYYTTLVKWTRNCNIISIKNAAQFMQPGDYFIAKLYADRLTTLAHFLYTYGWTVMEKVKDKVKKQAPKQKIGTTLTFSAEELMVIARYIAAGMILLQTKHSVVARIKGALTRLGLQSPKGL